ncbi:TonB-dependent receptor [Henriciella sp.]|uniref:TonB-dependent receptor n=1 Tax=Henriciella sp. TaxID=1968823 RepID=UPI0026103775|nr:TonB-dependent receptor [Henriciella sp.]
MISRATFRHSLVTGASLMALAGLAPAVAQEAESATTTAAETQPAEADGNMRLRSIQVTAQRREESINNVGMNIQAFDEESLDNLRVNSVDDLQSVVPSFTVSQSYQGVPTYTLRGIGFNTINLSSTSTVGTYVDEVAYPYPIMNSGPVFDVERVEVLKGPQGTLFGRNTTAGLLNVVTNKPTDEFEGFAAIDVGNYETINYEGMLNVPIGDAVQARVAARYETSGEGWQKSVSRGEDRGKVDKLGYRGALAFQPTSDLNIDFSINGWINKSDTIGGQGFAFTPATDPANGNTFNEPGLADFLANNQPQSAEDADWAPRADRETDIGVGKGVDGPLEEDSSFVGYKLAVDYQFNDDMRIVSLTGYNDLQREANLDWSGVPYQILIQDIDGEITSFSHEIRLEGSTDKVDWLVGGYYGKDEITDSNRTLLRDNSNSNQVSTVAAGLAAAPVPTVAALLGVDPSMLPPEQVAQINALVAGVNVDPETGQPYSIPEILNSFQTYRDIGQFETETASIFANANWQLTDEFELITGIRYTEDKQDYVGCSRDVNGSMQPNINIFNRIFYTLTYGVTPPAALEENGCNTYSETQNAFGPVTSDLTEDNISWRVVGNYTPTDDLLLFASVSRGFKSASTPVNAASKAEQNAPATQEKLTAYEVGVKAGLLEQTLQANASLFYYDYTDKQVSSFFPDDIYTALSRLQNAPEGEAYGLDAEVTWLLTDYLTAVGGLTLLHTEYGDFPTTDFAGQPTNNQGDPFLYSPERTMSLSLIYDDTLTDRLGLRAALSARWQSDSTAGDPDNPFYDIPSYGVVNGSIGVYSLDENWEVGIWGKNLLDEYYWQQITSNANVILRFAGQPRTYGASLTYRF